MQNLNLKLLVLLLLLAGSVAAQSRVYLEPRLGIGTFRMKSMKEFQQTMIQSSGVNARATDRFGPYFQYGFNVVTDLDDHARVGLVLERGSTGGRVAYEDYSGEFRIDQMVSYNALGVVIYSHQPIRESGLSFLSGIEANAFFSKLRLEGYSRIYDSSESSDGEFNAIGFGLKPFVGLQHPVFNFPASITLGYMASGNGAFHLPGEPDYKLARNSSTTNNTLEPSWSGLRILVSVSFPVINSY